jgi:hypothetical protein
MPRKIDPNTLSVKHGTLPSGTVDDNAFRYPERDVDPLRVHLHDPSRAHMASAVGIVDAADCYVSDEVEGALQEICSGMGAGRMNGLVEGGYIVSPTDGSGNPPYPNPTAAAGLVVTLVAPATGNPSTVLIGAHTVDISGATYDFATGVDPVSGNPTSVAGIYYLYVETDNTSPDYRGLVASLTLPTVALEKILIARIVHAGGNISVVTDARYFVANLDRKLPYTLRSGIPTGTGTGTFGGEDTDTWSEALFQTLDAALFWINNYDGAGDTQEEKATIIIRGRQVLNQNYDIPEGVCLQGSGTDAEIVWEGSGSLFTLTGNNIRIFDLKITLDNDINVVCKAIVSTLATVADDVVIERCTFSKTAASLHWYSAVDATAGKEWHFQNCSFEAGRGSSPVLSFENMSRISISDCGIDGVSLASEGVYCGGTTSDVTIRSCWIDDGDATGSSTGLSFQGVAAAKNIFVEDVRSTGFAEGVYSTVANTNITNCVLEGSPTTNRYGIYYATPAGSAEGLVVITGNVIITRRASATYDVDFDPAGIFIEGGSTSSVVSGNTVRGTWFNNNASNTSGIILGGALVLGTSASGTPANTRVSGNLFDNSVIVDFVVPGFTFTGNTVVTTDAANTNENLRIGAGSTNATITGNTFDGMYAASEGLIVYGDAGLGTSNITVTGNTFKNHTAAGISFAGSVSDSVIASNTLTTEYNDNANPTAEAIRLESSAATGGSRLVRIDGNTISRFIRGVVAVGLGGHTQLAVTNNSIYQIGQGFSTLWNQDTYDTMSQGVVLAYCWDCQVTGNDISTVGAVLTPAGAPILTNGFDYYGVGIHSFQSMRVSVTNNNIRDLLCHKAAPIATNAFNIGVYFDVRAVDINVPYEPMVCSGNQIHNFHETTGTNRKTVLAGVLVYGDSQLLAVNNWALNQLDINNNTIDVSYDTLVSHFPTFLKIGLGGRGLGGCGILCAFKNSVPGKGGAAWGNVSIADNNIRNYGSKGIAVYSEGQETLQLPGSNLRIQNNSVEGNGGRNSYEDETTAEMDGSIVVLQGRSTVLSGVAINANTLFSSLQCGICLGTTGGTGAWVLNSILSGVTVNDNTIHGITTGDGVVTGVVDTYGVMFRYFGTPGGMDQNSMHHLQVNNNAIGDWVGVPAADSERFGVFFQFSTPDNAGTSPTLRQSATATDIQVQGNQISTVLANIVVGGYGRANASSAVYRDISIQGNSCRRDQVDQSATGLKNQTVAYTALGLDFYHAQLWNVDVANNNFEAQVSGGGTGTGITSMSLEVLDGGTLGAPSSVSQVRVSDNKFEGSTTASTAYSKPAMYMRFDETPAKELGINNNTFVGGVSIDVQSGTVQLDALSIVGNVFTGKAFQALVVKGTATNAVSHTDGFGITNLRISGNDIEAYVPASGSNDAFQVYVRNIKTNFHNVEVSNNSIDLAGMDGGGLRVVVSDTTFADGINIVENRVKDGARPHIWWAASLNSISNNLRIDNNTCTGLVFPDGGWDAGNGHPDSVILFEGASSGEVSSQQGDEMISISGNIIRGCKSSLPSITDTNGVGLAKLEEPNSGIYFGPDPQIAFNEGVSPGGTWNAVRNIFIDGNDIQGCLLGTGLVLNAFPVKWDVTNISMSRNVVGHPTKNPIQGGVAFVTPENGLEFLGKYLYDGSIVGAFGNGRQGISEVAIDANQFWLQTITGHINVKGIIAGWESQWDLVNPETNANTWTYSTRNFSVCSNKVFIQLHIFPGAVVGIDVIATSDVANLRVDNNQVSVPKDEFGLFIEGMDRGIWLHHLFSGSEGQQGLRVQPLGGTQTTTYEPEEGVWLTANPAHSGTGHNELRGVYPRGSATSLSMKLVKWDNISLSDNQVLGACIYNSTFNTGNPFTRGAMVLQLVNYNGITTSNNRKMTMVPVYNLRFSGNTCKNDYIFDPESFATYRSVGFRILYTGLARNTVTLYEGTSGLYRAWNAHGNTANWYCLSNAASAQAIAPGNTKGWDVYFDDGGYSDVISGAAQENYCAQNDGTNTGWGTGGGGPFLFSENLNEIPWLKP